MRILVTWPTELVVVHEGDTVASIATAARAPDTTANIRATNGLKPDEEPAPGTLLRLPDAVGGQQRDAAVLSVRGPATVALPGGAEARPSPGMALPVGAEICTGSGGTATVRLAVSDRGGIHDDITLLSETCLTVRATTTRPGRRSSVVGLRQGSVTVAPSGPGEAGGTITVETDAGITTAEAGGFRVHVEADDAARPEALDTPLSVLSGGSEQRLQLNQGSRVPLGGVPSSPTDRLHPGALRAPLPSAPLRRPDFAWLRVPDALGYQLELSADEGLRDLVLATPVDRPGWEPDRLLLPADVPGLYWRVAAIDAIGFIGRPSEERPLSLPPGVDP